MISGVFKRRRQAVYCHRVEMDGCVLVLVGSALTRSSYTLALDRGARRCQKLPNTVPEITQHGTIRWCQTVSDGARNYPFSLYGDGRPTDRQGGRLRASSGAAIPSEPRMRQSTTGTESSAVGPAPRSAGGGRVLGERASPRARDGAGRWTRAPFSLDEGGSSTAAQSNEGESERTEPNRGTTLHFSLEVMPPPPKWIASVTARTPCSTAVRLQLYP
ncbi:hypothetical protein THAOC_29291 [Thalassiosira oceanica]|uniref:Uncharacterized protein n=1 Tax=Thalassiosira oceanica TaxID=159749 RepID=K0RRI4_THAOC|nr:hypothetical protein THAOC_29291 [Thalassiosira oceanica]|eukprot:EJK51531.1 hypothetical protein THAOC_29291 [Thalassiosira oceanica]